jgi:hypothetical protein
MTFRWESQGNESRTFRKMTTPAYPYHWGCQALWSGIKILVRLVKSRKIRELLMIVDM